MARGFPLRREHLQKRTALLDNALAVANKSVIGVQEVFDAWAFILLRVRDRFLRLPNKIAPRIPYLKDETAIAAEIQREVEEILTELSRPVDYDATKPNTEDL